MEEIWRDVVGFERFYSVSNLGKIRSNKRLVSNNRYLTEGQCNLKIIYPRIKKLGNCKGYSTITLSKDKKSKTYRLCRIVAEAFILNPENKPQVNHIDGNKLNDNILNLEWVTAKENVRHAFENNLNISKKGSEHKSSIKVINQSNNMIFDTIREASDFINISESQLSRILRGKYKNKTGLKIYNATL